MELVEGRTLKDRLEAGPLPVKDLLDLAAQIARGLATAHARRHRRTVTSSRGT